MFYKEKKKNCYLSNIINVLIFFPKKKMCVCCVVRTEFRLSLAFRWLLVFCIYALLLYFLMNNFASFEVGTAFSPHGTFMIMQTADGRGE